MTDKTPRSVLSESLRKAEQNVKVGGKYYHYKNPAQIYKVLDVGVCEWEEAVVVLYKELGKKNPLTWVRRYKGEGGFIGKVNHNDKRVQRFTLVQ